MCSSSARLFNDTVHAVPVWLTAWPSATSTVGRSRRTLGDERRPLTGLTVKQASAVVAGPSRIQVIPSQREFGHAGQTINGDPAIILTVAYRLQICQQAGQGVATKHRDRIRIGGADIHRPAIGADEHARLPAKASALKPSRSCWRSSSATPWR